MIITCYRIRSGFANVIDKITLVRPKASDVIYDELRLVLPAGYSLAETVTSEPCIYDDSGNAAELCLNNLRGSAILIVSSGKAVEAKKAPKGRTLVKLQEARLAAGLTAKRLSEISGVSIRQIQRVESGESEAGNLAARNLLALADALDIDPRTLL